MKAVKFRCSCGRVIALSAAKQQPGAEIRCPSESCDEVFLFPTPEEWVALEKRLLW